MGFPRQTKIFKNANKQNAMNAVFDVELVHSECQNPRKLVFLMYQHPFFVQFNIDASETSQYNFMHKFWATSDLANWNCHSPIHDNK